MPKIAIIPARGGSKRIPRKNIRDFLGKPIIAYSIEIALRSNLFDEVMVSTDDAEIAKIAKSYGATVPFIRSSSSSDDMATTADVIQEVLERYRKDNKNFAIGCCIYPTAPFVSELNLEKSIKKLIDKDFDTVFPVVKYSYPIQRALKVNQEKMSLFSEEYKNSRSQDLEESYHDAGQFYTFKVSEFLESNNLWTNNTGVIELSEMSVQDVDTENDWKLAELKYKLLNG